MINPDDIDAFAEANEPAMDAVDEFIRRGDTTERTDRWYDGPTGLKEIHRGCKAQKAVLLALADALSVLLAEKQDAGRLFTSHSKYAQKEE